MVPDPNERDTDESTGNEGSSDGTDAPGDGPNGGSDGESDDGGTWFGVDVLSGTKDATVDLLWPFDAGVWLRLAVIVFFVGGVGGLPTGGGNVGGSTPGGGGAPPEMPPLPDVPVSADSLVGAVIALVVLLALLAVVYAAVAGVMEFVLVESLRTREVRIRSRFREFLGPGLRLFGFRVVVGLVAAALVVIPLALAFGLGFAVSPAFLLLALPAFALIAVAAIGLWAVNRVTTDFVVPTMLAEDRGVVDGWRRVWPLVREQWAQVGVYLLLRVGIGIGAGIAVGIVTLIASLVVAIPFALVGGGAVLLAGWTTAGVAVVAVLVAAFALVAILVSLLAQVAPVTFLRYYALGVLGRLDAELNLVPWFEEVSNAS
jgi:hypothetical protein